MPDPVAASLRPPADLDARYQPVAPFAAWRHADADLRLVDEAAAELAQECRTADEATVRAALDFAVRAAAFDTGAIEGLYDTDRGVTFAVAAQAAAWESVVTEVSGRDAIRHFEAQLRGFELVLDAVTGQSEISAAWVRALHEMVCAGQDTFRALTPVGWQDLPLPKGEYERTPNHVRQPDGTWHPYAPPDLVTAEMQRLVDEIGSARFAAAHPVTQAAYVHHALVGIHPFPDGNGRVARAVASVFLYRAARVPMLVFADQRVRYLAALRSADRGDQVALIGFVRDVAIDAIELVSQALRTARTAGALDRLASLGGEEAAPPDQHQLHFLADRLRAAVQDGLHDVAASVGKDLLTVNITRPDLPGASAAAWDEWPSMSVVVKSPRRAGPDAVAAATVGVAPEPGGRWPLQVVAEGPDHHRATVRPMRLRLGNLYPTLTTVTQQRIREWARQLVGALAAELLGAAEPADQGERYAT